MDIKNAYALVLSAFLVTVSGTAYASISCEQCGTIFHCDTTNVADTYNWTASGPGYFASPNGRAYRRWQCNWSGAVSGILYTTVDGVPGVQQTGFGFWCPISA